MAVNLAIIGASYLQLPLIKKAKEMGYTTHVFAWKANDVGETEADFFYPISITEYDKIIEKCKEIGINGICSIGSDLAMVAVNRVAASLNLVGNPIDVMQRTTNKHLMRECFEKNGCPSPKSIQVDENTRLEELLLEYPVIVKPTDRSGSRGIFKLDSENGLKEAVKKAIDESFEKKALVEEFAEGKEYSVEFISYNGEHHFLALTEKFTTGAPSFIETGHIQPAPVSEKTLENVKATIVHALDSLGVKQGASHSEVKIDENGKIKIIEIGARMGGGCIGSDLVHCSTGIDFVKAVIETALGKKPDLTPEFKGFPVRIQFIFEQKDIEKMEQIKQEGRLIRIPDFHPEKIGHITDDSNRAGCYIYKD